MSSERGANSTPATQAGASDPHPVAHPASDSIRNPGGSHISAGGTAWINCSAGVAGDMLLAGLIDAGADRLAVLSAWSALGIDGYAATWERVDRSGVGALWTNLVIDQAATPRRLEPHRDHTHGPTSNDQHDHVRHHRHDHHHHDHSNLSGSNLSGHTDHASHDHDHRPASEVIALIEAADLDVRVRRDAVRVYRTLAATEAAIHNQPVDDVELHEVGALDAILDIVGVCAALADLDIDLLTYSAIGLGSGTVNSAHGTIPHPAPATVSMLADASAPVAGIDTAMETATPTGVALLTVLGVPSAAPPAIEIHNVGYGAGTANPEGRANVIQVVVGQRRSPVFGSVFEPTSISQTVASDAHITDRSPDLESEALVVVETNVDDVSGEIVAFVIGRLLDIGALDAWATPIQMKKGRPGVTIHALSRPSDLGAIRDTLLTETGSWGARTAVVDRWSSPRRYTTVNVGGHDIGIKLGSSPQRSKVEFDDAARAARVLDRPVREVLREAARLAEAIENDRAPG